MKMCFDEHVYSHSQYIYVVYTLPKIVGKRLKNTLLFLHLAKKGFGTRDSYKTIIKIRKSHWHDVNAFQNDLLQKNPASATN